MAKRTSNKAAFLAASLLLFAGTVIHLKPAASAVPNTGGEAGATASGSRRTRLAEPAEPAAPATRESWTSGRLWSTGGRSPVLELQADAGPLLDTVREAVAGETRKLAFRSANTPTRPLSGKVVMTHPT